MSLSTLLRLRYASLSNLPLCFSLLLRGIVIPIPRLAKYPRIRLFEYALSAATLKGKRLGLPRPLRLMAPPSINFSNTVDSCVSPGVSSNTTGLPLPSQRTCNLVENPPLLRPKASVSGPAFGSHFLPRLRAGGHAQRSYPQSVSPTLLGLWCLHLSAPRQVCGPKYLLHAIDRSERTLFYTSHSVQVNPPRVPLFSLSIGYR